MTPRAAGLVFGPGGAPRDQPGGAWRAVSGGHGSRAWFLVVWHFETSWCLIT